MSDLLEPIEARHPRAVSRKSGRTLVTELLWLCIIALVGLAISAAVLDPQAALALLAR